MTTTAKRVLCVQRLRHIPAQFSWIDQQLVFQGHLGRLDAHAAALYLFLLTVADALGLSYWGDARVARLLGVAPVTLARARQDLMRAGLIETEGLIQFIRQRIIPGGRARHQALSAAGQIGDESDSLAIFPRREKFVEERAFQVTGST